MRKGFILFTILVTILITGCANQTTTNGTGDITTENTEQTTTTVETTVDILQLKEALTNMKTLSNYQNNVVINIETNNVEQTTEMLLEYDLDDKKDGIIKLSVDGDVQVYFESYGNNVISYGKSGETWTKEVISKQFIEDLNSLITINSYDLDYLINNNLNAKFISVEEDIVTYELNVLNSDLFFIPLTISNDEILYQFKVTETELIKFIQECNYVVKFDKNEMVVVSIEVDFTDVLKKLFTLATSRGVEVIENINLYKITTNFSEFDKVNLQITNEMKGNATLHNTYVNILKTLNYQNDLTTIVDSTTTNQTYQFDMLDSYKGIIKIGNDIESVYIENDMETTSYAYEDGVLKVTKSSVDQFISSPHNALYSKDNFAFLLTEGTLVETNGELQTFEFSDNNWQFLLASLGVTQTSFLDNYALSVLDLYNAFEDFKFKVTINTKNKVITSIEFDYTDVLNELYQISEDRLGVSYPTLNNYEFKLDFSKYNEIELTIPEDMKV